MTRILQKLKARNRTEAAIFLRDARSRPEPVRVASAKPLDIAALCGTPDDEAPLRVEQLITAVPDALAPAAIKGAIFARDMEPVRSSPRPCRSPPDRLPPLSSDEREPDDPDVPEPDVPEPDVSEEPDEPE